MNELKIERNIICIDLKSFFASVECIDRKLDPFTTPLVVADIKNKLEKRVGKKIILKIEVNKDIIGGGIVKMGDQIIDGSIKRQIENIKNTF